MRLRCLFLILLILVLASANYSYAQDVSKETGEEGAQIEKPARQVQDRKDALEIAKDYLREEKMQADYHLVGHMTKPLAKLKDGVWHVVFLKKRKDDRTVRTESIRIIIEEDTARVLEHEEQEGFFIDRTFR